MNPTEIIHPSWNAIRPYLNQEPLIQLNEQILPDCKYYPEKENIFRVFKQPLDKVKVVILGQDPYFSPGQANGLAFAVNEGVVAPPSLQIIHREIFKEFEQGSYTVGQPPMTNKMRTLEHWENQGVFLLNTALTVEAGNPGSHIRYWENFTRKAIHLIAEKNPCVFMLWGAKAQKCADYLPNKFMVRGYNRETIEMIPATPYKNYILSAAHPAAEAYNPDRGGFYGCEHFYFANKILEKTGKETINW